MLHKFIARPSIKKEAWRKGIACWNGKVCVPCKISWNHPHTLRRWNVHSDNWKITLLSSCLWGNENLLQACCAISPLSFNDQWWKARVAWRSEPMLFPVLHQDRMVKQPIQRVVRGYWWELINGGCMCGDGDLSIWVEPLSVSGSPAHCWSVMPHSTPPTNPPLTLEQSSQLSIFRKMLHLNRINNSLFSFLIVL